MHVIHNLLHYLSHSTAIICLEPVFTSLPPLSPKYAHTTAQSANPVAVTQPLTNAEMRILEKESFACFGSCNFFSFPVMPHSIIYQRLPRGWPGNHTGFNPEQQFFKTAIAFQYNLTDSFGPKKIKIKIKTTYRQNQPEKKFCRIDCLARECKCGQTNLLLRYLEANIQKPQNPPSPLQKGSPLPQGRAQELRPACAACAPFLTGLSPSTQTNVKVEKPKRNQSS